MAATNFQSLIRVALFSFLCAFDINRRIQIAPNFPTMFVEMLWDFAMEF